MLNLLTSIYEFFSLNSDLILGFNFVTAGIYKGLNPTNSKLQFKKLVTLNGLGPNTQELKITEYDNDIFLALGTANIDILLAQTVDDMEDLPTGDLRIGTLCYIIDDETYYSWDGSAWNLTTDPNANPSNILITEITRSELGDLKDNNQLYIHTIYRITDATGSLQTIDVMAINSSTLSNLAWNRTTGDFGNYVLNTNTFIAISGGGGTDLGYTASATNGIVTSDTGTDATIPLADGTNAGLLKPAKFTVLENTSGTNTGDETAARIGTIVNGATNYTTPLDADKIGIWDTLNSLYKAVTWANIKATLKTYFDTLYPSGSGTSTGTNTGDNAVNSLYSELVSNATHSGDATGATVLTLATVNSNVGSFTNANITVNAKGLITAAANGSGGSSTLSFERKVASYTLVLTDAGKVIEMNITSTANTLTVPLGSGGGPGEVLFPVGTVIHVIQRGTGQTTITATPGVTLNSSLSWLKLAAQNSAVTLLKVATDEWYVFGQLAP